MKQRRIGTGLAAVAAMAVFVSCADPEERSLCTAYERVQDAADSLREVSLDGQRAGEAADSVEAVLGEVRNLGAVADTRYSTEINQLEVALNDLLRTLESVQDDAESDTWKPLVADSVEDAQQAAALVTKRIAPVCDPQD